MLKKGLGRGLDSLIPNKVNAQNYTDFKVDNDNDIKINKENIISLINPKDIIANPYQPRKDFNEQALADLMNSIKEHGILQPLVVGPKKGSKYELIAGERRLRSAVALKLEEVPVIIRDVSNQKKLELALIENLQRENLNSIDSAIAYNQLANEFNLTQEELSKKLSKARSSIANTLRFLNLPSEIQNALAKGQISEAHAKYLLSVEGEVKQLSLFKKIIYNNLSVRETDNLIKQSGSSKRKAVQESDEDKFTQERLCRSLSTKVELKRNSKGGGSINILFYSDQDLNDILKKISK